MSNIKEVEPANSNGCGDTDLIQQFPILLPEQYADLNNDYADREPSTMEKTTREQSDSTWFEEQKNRLTTSNFGRVLNRKLAPKDFFKKFAVQCKTNIRTFFRLW